jgi:hypothetical protein
MVVRANKRQRERGGAWTDGLLAVALGEAPGRSQLVRRESPEDVLGGDRKRFVEFVRTNQEQLRVDSLLTNPASMPGSLLCASPSAAWGHSH